MMLEGLAGDDNDGNDASSSLASDDDAGDGGSGSGGSGSGGSGSGSRGRLNGGGFVVYYWQGLHAKRKDWVHWQMCGRKHMRRQLRRIVGDFKVVRVVQGREPEHLRRIFSPGFRTLDNRLCVHVNKFRKQLDPDWRLSLYKLQSMPQGTAQAFQVPPHPSSLSSRSIFICIR
jgi:hypothetical protein